MSQEAFDFIDRLLDLDPMTRLGSHGVDEVMRHPFFDGIDWEQLQNTVSVVSSRHAQMYDMPFVPIVDDPTDTRYFAESNEEERAITASLSLSMCLTERQDEDAAKSAVRGDEFEGFDYSNLFNLREMNEQAENQERLRLNEVSSGVASENEPAEGFSTAAEKKDVQTHDVELPAASFSEESEVPAEVAHDPSEDSPNTLSFCDVKVEVNGDYIHYTFDFQQGSESE